ncbi:hypothetical protein FLP15_05135 [Lactococcus protaetiae]|uniref:HTH-type transcriptional regulator Rgg C-terminal domain-containing protein n=1 Tax=Lactococcus protaetiae TaxID=2592653 RepID=A0A514Z7V1_9LACT|nr:hypothetical protein FLP15_05135 [Lactococcus protaetiae]
MLREERELKTSDFKEYGISKSTLDKFESGRGNLAFDKLDEALQMMNVSLHEYSYLLNDGVNDYFIDVFEEIDNAFYSEDIARLKNIYEENIQYPENRLFALSAKACYETLTEKEQENISDYLFSVEHWGAKELWIFTDTIDQLSLSTVILLLNEFLIKSKYYQGIYEYNRLIIQAANNAVAFLIRNNQKEAARKVLRQMENQFFEVDLFARVLYHFMLGYWDYIYQDKVLGNQMMNHSLHILKFLEATHIHNVYYHFYKNHT